VGATLCLSSLVYPSSPLFARQVQLRFLLCVEQTHQRMRPRLRTYPAAQQRKTISKRGTAKDTAVVTAYDGGVDVLPQLDGVINSHAKLG
jgi:hypothetical protein